MDLTNEKIAVVGLGYVGLPVAAAFARHRAVVGYDANPRRIAALRAGHDVTGEVSPDELAGACHLTLTDDAADLSGCTIFIVAVPTPVDAANRPDLHHLEAATRTVGAALSPGSVVIYESTVYPGCTRNVCGPILARASGLELDEGFFLGYSPERANPGDRDHRLATIVKVTAGSTPEAASAVDALYREIVPAGTHCAPSIEVAEAAKIIENTQRDIIREFHSMNAQVDVWDPWVPAEEAAQEYGLDLLPGEPEAGGYDAIVLAVAHDSFRALGAERVRAFGGPQCVLFDVKAVFDRTLSDGRL